MSRPFEQKYLDRPQDDLIVVFAILSVPKFIHDTELLHKY